MREGASELLVAVAQTTFHKKKGEVGEKGSKKTRTRKKKKKSLTKAPPAGHGRVWKDDRRGGGESRVGTRQPQPTSPKKKIMELR